MFKRPAFRFTLLTLLLVVTLAAASVSHWLTSRELLVLRERGEEQKEQIRELSHRLGELTPEDLPYVQVKSISTDHMPWELAPVGPKRAFQWHVHLPSHKKWRLCFATNAIPLSGVPEGECTDLETTSSVWSELGLEFRHEEELGWTVHIRCEAAKIKWLTVPVPASDSHWLDQDAPTSLERAGEPDLHNPEWLIEQFSCGQPVVLYRERRFIERSDWEVKENPEPCEGFMLWLVAVEDASATNVNSKQ
jgi:hypothetical protein